MARVRDLQAGPSLWEESEDERDQPQSERSSSSDRPPRLFLVEADGGSRGNPGPAAYGALVRDAETGELLAEEGLRIGENTNNVAEYSGLIAGLEMARTLDPEAVVEVRMDSKLVIEQMTGRWKIKHPSMRPLALRARELLPADISWTWIPRERNKAADALVNRALDGRPVTRWTS